MTGLSLGRNWTPLHTPSHLHRPMDHRSLPGSTHNVCSELIVIVDECLVIFLCYKNVRTIRGPTSPSEQYMPLLLQNSLSMRVTLTSMSTSDIRPDLFSLLVDPQPETMHDFGEPSFWPARGMAFTVLLNFTLELNLRNRKR